MVPNTRTYMCVSMGKKFFRKFFGNGCSLKAVLHHVEFHTRRGFLFDKIGKWKGLFNLHYSFLHYKASINSERKYQSKCCSSKLPRQKLKRKEECTGSGKYILSGRSGRSVIYLLNISNLTAKCIFFGCCLMFPQTFEILLS